MSEWFNRQEWQHHQQQPQEYFDWEWGLEGCCNVDERLFLSLYVIYAVLFLLFHETYLLKPIRLLTVFLHEFGHASACWITGGSVRKLEVYENEGGVTGYRGGCRILVRARKRVHSHTQE
jgi:hypothetical protein